MIYDVRISSKTILNNYQNYWFDDIYLELYLELIKILYEKFLFRYFLIPLLNSSRLHADIHISVWIPKHKESSEPEH